jgi:hypothetical protein
VQEPTLVGDLVLLLRQVVDQLLEVVVAERCEVGEGFHGPPFWVEDGLIEAVAP